MESYCSIVRCSLTCGLAWAYKAGHSRVENVDFVGRAHHARHACRSLGLGTRLESTRQLLRCPLAGAFHLGQPRGCGCGCAGCLHVCGRGCGPREWCRMLVLYSRRAWLFRCCCARARSFITITTAYCPLVGLGFFFKWNGV